MIVAAVYDTLHGRMALITDEELVGKSRFDQERGIILMLPESIYKGKLVTEEEAREIMLSASILVVTGERSVQLAVELGLVHPDSITMVKGIPHAYVYKIDFSPGGGPL
jgi:hypothetical protein